MIPKEVLWIESDVILLVSSLSWNEDRITRIHFKPSETPKEYKIAFVAQETCKRKIWRLVFNSTTKSIFIVFETGQVKKYNWLNQKNPSN